MCISMHVVDHDRSAADKITVKTVAMHRKNEISAFFRFQQLGSQAKMKNQRRELRDGRK